MAKHGRYKIGRKVADGGMAEIFLATQLGHEGFQKPVILKRIHGNIYSDPQFKNMFIDEAHISMSLSHSNIVQVLDLGAGAGRYFLVLELVDGWDLGRVLHRAAAAHTPLPRELGLLITAEVCRALAYAHAKADGDRPLGIVHRDVSPHNILVSEQGEVKLTDFGIAKAMNKREHTGTGVVKGKVAFMSPEQAMGRAIDARSDLFSLGTILYLLMTRVRPFEGTTDLETLLRVQKADFRPAEAVAPDLEMEVAAIIGRAMSLDPADRYQSADEMLADIERAQRTVYQPVGQTELKRWLAELAARDGVLAITKTVGKPSGTRGGSAELEGKDVVLSDSSGEVDGEEATSLAVVEPTGEPRRVARARDELPLPVPVDDEAALSGRHSGSELALPVPDDERPGRRRARRGSGVSILVFGVLLVAAAAAAGRYLGLRAEQSRVDKRATRESDEPPQAAAGDAPAIGSSPAAAKEPASRRADENQAAREPAGHRPRPAPANEKPNEKPAERPRRGIDGLKDMMAPDPSLLPSPAPAAASPAPVAPAPAKPAPAAEPPPAAAPAPVAPPSPANP
jgi:serine/threonine protein kinase